MSKRLLVATLLVGFLASFGCRKQDATSADKSKLGKAAMEKLKVMLYADQGLDQVCESIAGGTNQPPDSPWALFQSARKNLQSGHTTEAIANLRKITALADVEDRVKLWAWSCLRKQGEQPTSESGPIVRGVVLEVPVGRGTDTLAAYADGSARYLNFSGGGVFWDSPDTNITTLCRKLIAAAQPLYSSAKPRAGNRVPGKGCSMATLLAYAGNRSIEVPMDDSPVMAAGTELMLALINKSKR